VPVTLPTKKLEISPIKSLHLGITPWRLRNDLSATAICDQAELAESWGYDSFFLPESHFAGRPSLPDPMLLLAAVAARTDKILLGTTSYLLPIRHALLAAEQVATLDQLCQGRLILGLGRGYQPGMLEAFGVAQRDKRTRFEDILEAMLAAWRGDYVGEPARLLQLSPLPVQQPHPPLWIAGFGPKAIAQIGGLGLPYLASPIETLAELEENHKQLHAAMAAANKSRPDEVVIMRTIFISDDNSACEQVREKLLDAPRPPNLPKAAAVEDWALIGDRQQVQAELERYQSTLNMTHLIAVRPRVRGIDEPAIQRSMELLRQLLS
jgi:alkanesulfonate monooxygenase SsuD/methylene tetrahydromethanopterin reductase-like flavin-dependent oxidoreductase (luciferase family)